MTQLVAVRVYYYQIDAKLPESAQPARPPPRALPCISYAIGAKIMSYTMLRVPYCNFGIVYPRTLL